MRHAQSGRGLARHCLWSQATRNFVVRQSLTALILVCFVLSVAPGAHAEGYIPKIPEGWVYSYGGPGGLDQGAQWSASVNAACQRFKATLPTSGDPSSICSVSIDNRIDLCTGGPWQSGSLKVIATAHFTPLVANGCDGRTVDWMQYDRTVYSQLSPSICPPDSSEDPAMPASRCICNAGMVTVFFPAQSEYRCIRSVEDEQTHGGQCTRYGNPIFPVTGTKRELVGTGLSIGRDELSLTYDSARKPHHGPVIPWSAIRFEPAGFGQLWLSSLHRKLDLGLTQRSARVLRGDGSVSSFAQQADGTYRPAPHVSDRLFVVTGGYRYHDVVRSAVETYDSVGRLTSVAYAEGGRLTLAYSDASTPASIAPAPGLLIRVADSFGRTLSFEYRRYWDTDWPVAGPRDRVSRIVGADGLGTSVTYDANGNLFELGWADAAVRRFLYEAPNLQWALSGVRDEKLVKYALFGYDNEGRAVSTEHTGGVNRFSVSQTMPPAISTEQTYDDNLYVVFRRHTWQPAEGLAVTTSNGSTLTLGTISVSGQPKVTSRSQPAGAGCGAASSNTSYDANGNVASDDNFNGTRSCYFSDLARNLEITRVEGLPNTTACLTVTPASAVLPIGTRKTSTQWHPDWRRKTAQAEPGRLTTLVYNGQPDPFNGGAVASCAPTTATLPDGKPIVVLCKQVEQATTDVDGSKAFTVPGNPGSQADPSFASVGLLLHGNGASGSTVFTDNSASPRMLTPVGNAVISTAQSKFGGASMAFDGAGDYLTTPHVGTIDVSAGDFTIEGWVRPATNAGVFVLMKKGVGSGYGGFMIYLDNGKVVAQANDTGTALAFQLTSTTAIGTSAWSHFALTRAGSTFRLFVNGTLNTSSTYAGTLRNAAEVLSIGANSTGGYPFNGHLDDIRITKGVARYITSFTPPTVEFGNSVNGAPASPSYMDTTVPNRVWTYTYNQYGQVLTAKGPRTDVNDTTTYAYYADTITDHTIGDLQTVTNAVGKVTTYTKYNKHGQVLEMTDPNGVLTVNTYDLRQRLLSTSVGGQTTSYTYDPVGQLTRVTQPDASYIGYAYDDAHRLVAVFDNKNNRIDYTLDNAGNRIAETVKDPANVLSRQLVRVMDALNRVQQSTGRQ
jgi:YD repeat-containing protein